MTNPISIERDHNAHARIATTQWSVAKKASWIEESVDTQTVQE